MAKSNFGAKGQKVSYPYYIYSIRGGAEGYFFLDRKIRKISALSPQTALTVLKRPILRGKTPLISAPSLSLTSESAPISAPSQPMDFFGFFLIFQFCPGSAPDFTYVCPMFCPMFGFMKLMYNFAM